ncbi:ABC transporter permease [Halopiger aswanensis]|uniref:Monosaccharide ABC transporter membrane protein (CUT2 family) n=1 Tax=Halopiger aswanensis TaxID=148449 RepID=A0A3R7GW86_9EURY|nr:ABC transporter permease [Halopiger aswanensis]RKD95528.1 monosaccharide ABC transporter membrane protein (CUT2 family) [Halopiger aswanensis]
MSGATPPATDGDAVSRETDSRLRRLLQRRQIGVLVGFLLLFGLIGATRPDLFFSWDSLSNIVSRLLRQAAPYVIIGIGMTYLMIGGEFDLSVGSMYGVAGLTFAMLLTDYRLTVPAALVAVLVIGAAVGLANGVVVTKVGIPSLITTIGMMSMLRGVAYMLTSGGSQQTPDDLALLELFGGSISVAGVEITYMVFWMFGLLIAFGLVLQKTRFGHHVYATGDDQSAADRSGIDTDRIKIANFVITGLVAAFAGVVAISYYGSMFGSAGRGFELLIIAAVVIGGTNLFGGEGSISGMFLGSLVIAVIPVLLVLNNMSVDIQETLTGAVIIGAVMVDIVLRD